MSKLHLNSGRRVGIYLALTTAAISGVSIYLNKFAVQAVGDVLLFTTLKNSLVGLMLVVWLLAAGRRPATVVLSVRAWFGLVGLAVIGGSVPFMLFFKGLALASAPSAALIHKSLFLWVALLATPLLGERPGRSTLAGLGLLAAGHLLNGWPKAWGWGNGETLILLATLLWAGETVLARRMLQALPTSLAAAARMAGGAGLMWVYLLASGQAGGLRSLSIVQAGWVLLTSALLLGYVTTWYAALKRAPATVVTSALTVGAILTAGLGWVLERQAIGPGPAIGLAGMAIGVALVLGMSINRRRSVYPAAA